MTISRLLGECEHSLDRWMFGAFLLSVLGAAVSLPIGRGALALSLVLVCVGLARKTLSFKASAAFWVALAFVVVTVVVTINGLNPEKGTGKLDKFVWFIGLFVAPFVLTTTFRLRRMLEVYVAGNVFTALRTIIERPIDARRHIVSGFTDDWSIALAHGASMTDAQRLLLGMLGAMGLIFLVRHVRRSFKTWWWIALGLEALGLLMTFKRGAWICAVVAVSLLFAALTRWRYVVLPLIVVVALGFLPPVQDRLGELRKEFNVDGGGRLTMWFKIAPGLIGDHPCGIGYRSLTNDLMRQYAPEVEPGRDHLHSNFAQILVATGWLGLALYMLWMLAGLRDGCRYAVLARAGTDPPESIISVTLLCMLIGLMCNGVVEYNFGDAELVLAYGFLMGACTAGRMRSDFDE